MEFAQSLNQTLNSILGGQMSGGQMYDGQMSGGGMLIWIVIAVVFAAAGYLYWNEYFSCHSGRVSIDKKCVNMCPEGTTFKNVNSKNDKHVDCADAKGTINTYLMPQVTVAPAPTTTPASTVASVTPAASTKTGTTVSK
jgi:hypothetical protein